MNQRLFHSSVHSLAMIHDALRSLEEMVMEPNGDRCFDELEQQRKNDIDKVRSKIDDAEREIATLNESLRDLEDAVKSKTEAIEELQAQLRTKTLELEEIREETERNNEKFKKLRERKLEARSVFSVKDLATLEDTKMKLRVCCALTGVYFNSSEKSVSNGYVANASTHQVKLFDVGGLPRKEATKKLWETIEKTTALKDVQCSTE
ncbi:hypothetical protein GE061_011998 [Apolygus lucorum]|uniref:Uncharacterized protein n=1 Tax=Apolygus lucorum TaxID=248454 RepID=A0A6A4JKV5_APOLU|nr:hypothetical protein GE061_011998 [Apolygus lucorum]